MPGCQAATVNRCDSRADFDACPCYGYSAAGEPFGICPCSGYSTAAGEPFRRLPLPYVQRESSRLLYPFSISKIPFGESKCRRFTRSKRIVVSYACKIVCISIGSGCAHYILMSLSLISTRALSTIYIYSLYPKLELRFFLLKEYI